MIGNPSADTVGPPSFPIGEIQQESETDSVTDCERLLSRLTSLEILHIIFAADTWVRIARIVLILPRPEQLIEFTIHVKFDGALELSRFGDGLPALDKALRHGIFEMLKIVNIHLSTQLEERGTEPILAGIRKGLPRLVDRDIVQVSIT
ncbi:hypothetical protein OH76DRAFT_1480800 [Lentinus brumalis]|uniref:Uncharacterized protein n=1 Tax=Lentinus brumalis TaxID=2498619 RepID=A0A371DI25_9APHY|nr:hypothetical protein OH76DRAFT_1480800 [Polyporus brumalis]